MRDINQYTKDYIAPSFETYQVAYRRKKVLNILRDKKARVILEIGCGMEPLFHFMEQSEYDLFVVIEPSDVFYQNAVALAAGRSEILCIHDFFCEESAQKLRLMDIRFDMVICSSLLHELPAPEEILSAMKTVSSEETLIHINVPNANSIHRIWAKYAGLIRDEHNFSDRNVTFQQAQVFDLDSLARLLHSVGLETVEKGSYFIKPFSHAQMYKLLETGIIDERHLDGLDNMIEKFQEFGSEIYINSKVNVL